MKIGIVTSHHWALPSKLHLGDVCVLDLATALHQLGHEVVMFAPEGTEAPAKLCVMQSAQGSGTPSAYECEVGCYREHLSELWSCDIVHDMSQDKNVSELLFRDGRPVLQTLFGGRWLSANPPRNLCVPSESHRARVLRGQTDYVDTPTPDLAGPNGPGISEAHVVYLGVDTEFYCPGDAPKGSHWLWLGRWHPVRGYKMAIDVARATGIELVMSGENPSYMRWEAEKACAAEAVALARGLPNVRFEYLPPDPDHHTAKREQYRRAKALLLTTQFHEPFGLQQVEAAACGTPIMSTAFGSMPELGLSTVSQRNDPLIFSHLIGCLRGFSHTYTDTRAAAVGRFDRSVMARNYLHEYRSVIGGMRW